MRDTNSSKPQTLRLADFTTDRRVLFLMGLAIPVGVGGVISAWVLLHLIALCTNLAYRGEWSMVTQGITFDSLGAFSAVVPAVGCLIIGLMARYGSDKIRGHGIPEAMEAILIGRSRIQPKVAVLKPLSSAISIGTGGPFGAEGPIIMTGGAIGSLLAQLVRLTDPERKSLLVAGAAAGMTAVFSTPVAAVLLAVELLLFEWKPRSFLPVVVAVLVSQALRGYVLDLGPLFELSGHFSLSPLTLLGAVALGLVAGLASGLCTHMVYATEDFFEKLPIHWMWWPALGGVVIGVGGLIEPAALGVGYDNIRHLLAGNVAMSGVLLLLVVKAIIWSVSLGSGTSGGVVAPLLILGGALGTLAAPLLPVTDPGFWALVGMAALMGGTMRAPLTASIFALELTGNFSAIVPVFAGCMAAYGVTVLLLKRSILTEKIARRGLHILHEYRVDPFDLVRAAEVMTANVDTFAATDTVDRVIGHYSNIDEGHTSYPVVNKQNQVVGEVTRADALQWALQPGDESRTLKDMLDGRDAVYGHPDELAGAIADRMAVTGVGRIPIVDRDNGKLLGIIGRKDLFRIRARRIAQEQQRSAFLRPSRSK